MGLDDQQKIPAQTPQRLSVLSRDIWRSAWTIIKRTRRQTLTLALLGMVLPRVLTNLVLDYQSTGAVRAVQALYIANATQAKSFSDYADLAVAFISRNGGAILLNFIIFSATYMALVQTAVDCHRDVEPRGALRSWLRGAYLLVRGGLVAGALMLLLLAFVQALIFPAMIIAAAGLMIPVVLTAEGLGGFRSLWRGLTLRYVRGSGYSAWSVLFQLLLVGSLIYAIILLIYLTQDRLLVLDELVGLRRDPWTAVLPGVDFGPIYLALSWAETLATTAMTVGVPALTVSLYFKVVGRRLLAEA